MEYLQITLTIILLVIEVIAFAWLIIDIQKSKKKQDKIIELEHQILRVEDSIIELENVIVDKIDLLIGGSPCQSFSNVGDGSGFDGKSKLFWEFMKFSISNIDHQSY